MEVGKNIASEKKLISGSGFESLSLIWSLSMKFVFVYPWEHVFGQTAVPAHLYPATHPCLSTLRVCVWLRARMFRLLVSTLVVMSVYLLSAVYCTDQIHKAVFAQKFPDVVLRRPRLHVNRLNIGFTRYRKGLYRYRELRRQHRDLLRHISNPPTRADSFYSRSYLSDV